MQNFIKEQQIFYESKNGQLQVSVECTFTKVKQDNSVGALAYVTSKGVLYSNPNTYLVIKHVEEDYTKNSSLYTSFPHTYRLRELFKKAASLALSEATDSFFTKVDGIPVVNPTYADGLTLTGFPNDKSITLVPKIMQSSEISVGNEKAIAIIIGVDAFASILTVEEFLAVYQLIMDINLPALQTIMTAPFVEAYSGGAAQNQTQYAAQPVYQQTYAQPQYQQPRQYAQPQYQPRQTQPRVVQPKQYNVAPSQPQYQQPFAQQPKMTPRAETLTQPQMQPSPVSKMPSGNAMFKAAEEIQVDLDSGDLENIFED